MTREIDALHRLAQAAGIELSYRDVEGNLREASPDAICALLRALGHDLDGPARAAACLRDLEAERARRVLPRMVTAWEGHPALLPLNVSARRRWLPLVVELEEGRTRRLKLEIERGPAGARARLPGDLPAGRHRLHATLGKTRADAHLIVAPRRASDGGLGPHAWGVFLPLYSLRQQTPAGVANLGGLARLGHLAGKHGARFIGTLPLLDTFLDRPFEPSPYAPISRRFFAPVYLDLAAAPEMATATGARELLGSAMKTRAALTEDHDEVAWEEAWRLQRRVLTRLAARLDEGPSSRREALEAFAQAHPEVVAYARFRAAVERWGPPSDRWPASARGGHLDPSQVDPGAVRVHLYAQWLLHEQLSHLRQDLEADGVALYLDLPVGVHPDGFDVWNEPDLFLHGVHAGAPPDPFFRGGQDWGFAPLAPAALEAQGLEHVWACLEAHLRVARMLRIDHVMGLHRLYLIPEGMAATEGLYLRYPSEALFALVTLASRRFEARIVGENLGTVPEAVEKAIDTHGLTGMWVGQFALDPNAYEVLPAPPHDTLACLNTHDAPPFAGYCAGVDLDDAEALGLLSPEEAEAARRGRTRTVRALDRALRRRHLLHGGEVRDLAEAAYARLGSAGPDLLLVNLEDLWGEARPQNVPGTHGERPNWRRLARPTLAEMERDERLASALDRIDRACHPRVSARPVPPPTAGRMSDDDLYLLAEGTHHRLYRHLGAHPVDGGRATRFALWAPNAEAVSVVGDFNGWDPAATPLERREGSGVFEGTVLGVGPGEIYKYHLRARGSGEVREKADPYAFYSEEPPRSASVVWDLSYAWGDDAYLARRGRAGALDAPISIYEVHLGSWMRGEDGRYLSYREIAPRLIEHLGRTGFTHVELMPVMEHPYYGSWGYQVTGYFAPTARYGTPQDLMFLVDQLHQAGYGVILDWVPAHFPADDHALARFDGTCLYEHPDPRRGRHPDWGTLIFDYGRPEVRAFLLSSALFWLDHYHADGLRVDAVASMLYLDYSRAEGEWVPNAHGGRENLEALAFLRRLNEVVYAEHPGVQTFAEESTAWPGVSRPTYLGGVGFGLKWDMGWMHDTLAYLAHDPIHRRWHHHQLTFRGLYAFGENFVLPLSHDEVVHGKGSLIAKMPGDPWQKRANLRLLFAQQWGQPGKKLLFMGGELAQTEEWNHEGQLPWHLLDDPDHAGIVRLVHDLNRLYREVPALHRHDHDPEGFAWVEVGNAEESVYAWLRRGDGPGEVVLVVLNATPVVRHGHRLGVPRAGRWREVLNTDAQVYGGSGVGNLGGVDALAEGFQDWPASLVLTLPPLAALFLVPEP